MGCSNRGRKASGGTLLLAALLLGNSAAACTSFECSTSDIACDNGLNSLILATRYFRPGDLSGLQVWLKADSLVLNNLDTVTYWPDSSGNSHDASGGVSPSYRTGTLNGRPVMNFNGSQYLNLPTFAQQPAATPHTLFLVFRTAGTLDETILTTTDAPATGRVQLSHTLGCPQQIISTVLSGLTLCYTTTTYIDASWELFEISWNLTDISLYSKGALVHTQSVTATAGGGPWRMGADKTASTFINGDIAEFVIYSRALSDYERREVECYLGWKYGLNSCQNLGIYL